MRALPLSVSEYSLWKGCAALTETLERLGFQAGPKPLIGAGLGDIGAAERQPHYLQAAFVMGQELAKG